MRDPSKQLQEGPGFFLAREFERADEAREGKTFRLLKPPPVCSVAEALQFANSCASDFTRSDGVYT